MKSLEDILRRRVTHACIVNASIAAALVFLLYVMVVVLTTPSLPAFDAIAIALRINGVVISGMVVGIAIQSFLVTCSKRVSCSRKVTRAMGGVSGAGSVFSSFLSFFTLVPLGCCGTWLYIISFLPGVLGAGISASLIQHSRVLSFLGLAMMGASIAYTYISIMRAGKQHATRFDSREVVRLQVKARQDD